MRWTIAFLCALLVLGLVFFASPYVALYRLAQAVEARDVSALQRRVNIRAVRISLTRQIVTTWLEERDRAPGQPRRPPAMGAAGLGATIADPIVARLVTPDALIGLIDRGWPPGFVAPDGSGDAAPRPGGGVGLQGLRDVWRIFVDAESRGFRVMSFSTPHGAPAAERVRLVFRLQRFRWRLSGVDLPASLRKRLIQELPRTLD
jgi:hypothetical protein